MADLTLQQLFGSSASQTAETLTIHKADLLGLVPSLNNRGEQLLVAVLLQVHQQFEGVLTDPEGRAITDELGRAIAYDNRQLSEKLRLWFWRRQFVNSTQLDTFILEVFIKPPTPLQTPLSPNSLVY